MDNYNEEARIIINDSEYCQELMDTWGIDLSECLDEE